MHLNKTGAFLLTSSALFMLALLLLAAVPSQAHAGDDYDDGANVRCFSDLGDDDDDDPNVLMALRAGDDDNDGANISWPRRPGDDDDDDLSISMFSPFGDDDDQGMHRWLCGSANSPVMWLPIQAAGHGWLVGPPLR